jgi:hypothetical protein
MRWRQRLALGLGAAALLLGAACTTPTLPLPPPAVPSISTGTEPNTFRLASDKGGLPNALIVAVNRNESLPAAKRVAGTIADAQGSWVLDVYGTAGDVIDVSQEDGTTRSSPVSVTLK